ncbi:unnamed protein product [Soboliphyme baturini]|uniref:Uncharacterized protein n=1 Tax=Soboliphyme baturini TaxID=241478 RepID=A0A183IY09_9BILA|nr:unnamed protein product [Soboliphyme baturini]
MNSGPRPVLSLLQEFVAHIPPQAKNAKADTIDDPLSMPSFVSHNSVSDTVKLDDLQITLQTDSQDEIEAVASEQSKSVGVLRSVDKVVATNKGEAPDISPVQDVFVGAEETFVGATSDLDVSTTSPNDMIAEVDATTAGQAINVSQIAPESTTAGSNEVAVKTEDEETPGEQRDHDYVADNFHAEGIGSETDADDSGTESCKSPDSHACSRPVHNGTVAEAQKSARTNSEPEWEAGFDPQLEKQLKSLRSFHLNLDSNISQKPTLPIVILERVDDSAISGGDVSAVKPQRNKSADDYDEDCTTGCECFDEVTEREKTLGIIGSPDENIPDLESETAPKSDDPKGK